MPKTKLLRKHPPKLGALLEEHGIPTEEFVLYALDIGHKLNLDKTNFDEQQVMDLIGDFKNRDLEIYPNSDYE